MAKDLKLVIYDTTASPIPDGTAELFNASQLSWANIIEVWDECVSFYGNKQYKVFQGNNSIIAGIVVSSAAGTFQTYAEQDPSTFIGNFSAGYGLEGDLQITVPSGATDAQKDEAIKLGIFKKHFETLMGLLTFKITAKNSGSSIAANGNINITSASLIFDGSALDKGKIEIIYPDNVTNLIGSGDITYSNYSYNPNSSST